MYVRLSRPRLTLPDTAAAQLKRILAIIPALADDREHPLAEVADQAGVDVRTVLKDLQSLAHRYDEPGGFVSGVQLYLEADSVSVTTNHFLRPMRLTVHELRALELGLAALRLERPPDEHGAIDRARDRLQQVIAKLPDDELPAATHFATTASTGDARHMSAIRAALRERRKVGLTYRRGDADSVSTRTICPYAMVLASGMWYVIAHCEKSDGVRVFRLDRIEGVDQLGEHYEPDDSFRMSDVVRDGRVFSAPAEPMPVMRVWYSLRIARWIAEREGAELAEDGSLTLEHPLADESWAVRHVLQYGADAEVVEPPEVRALVVETLKRAEQNVVV